MRTNFDLPTGDICLNQDIPEATWNLPGLFVFDEFFFSEWKSMYDLFKVKPPVNSVSGSRNVKWNSGRVAPQHTNQGGNKKVYAQRLNSYKQFGINCYYTFSNNRLTKDDLNDRACNEMLEAMVENNHEGDGVILSSDLLADYLRKKYPGLKQKVSVVKSDVERPKERDAQWYNDLADRFDIVVLQPDDNFNLELLNSLKQKEKFELLVNEPCVKDCSFRKRHYDDTSKVAIGGYKDYSPMKKYFEMGSVCGIINYSNPDPRMRTRKTSCRMTREEVKEVYDLGFHLFKLQGRSNQMQLAYDISHYLYDNEFFSNLNFGAHRDMIQQAAERR